MAEMDESQRNAKVILYQYRRRKYQVRDFWKAREVPGKDWLVARSEKRITSDYLCENIQAIIFTLFILNLSYFLPIYFFSFLPFY